LNGSQNGSSAPPTRVRDETHRRLRPDFDTFRACTLFHDLVERRERSGEIVDPDDDQRTDHDCSTFRLAGWIEFRIFSSSSTSRTRTPFGSWND
jgi:hypothetical protein